MRHHQIADVATLWKQKQKARRMINLSAGSVAPMMDVMFNLLIFFLVATSFQLPEGLLEAKLPKSSGITDKQLTIPVVPIKIFLDKAGTDTAVLIRVSTSTKVDIASMMVLDDFDQLYSMLSGLLKKQGINTDIPVIIAARENVDWDSIVNAYNSAVRAKFKRIVFAEY